MTGSSLEKLIAKKAQIDAQIKAARARQASQKRKDDTRRKILDGGASQAEIRENPEGEYARLHREVRERRLQRDIDRALFDLDPLPSEPRQDFDRAKNAAKK